MNRRWTLWLSLALLSIGTVVAYRSAVFSSRSGAAAPLYSTRRYDPYGTAALQDLLVERGVQTRTLERASLSPDVRGVLIQVLPARVKGRWFPERHLQTRQVADWIAMGNTVVQFTRTPTDLMEHFKITPATEVAQSDLEAVELAESRGQSPTDVPGEPVVARLTPEGSAKLGRTTANRTDRLFLREPMTLTDRKDDRSFTPLARASSQNGAIVAAEYKVGRGAFIVVGSSSPVLNNTIGEEGNLEFVLGLAGEGPVVLDEWSHGVGHEATVIGFLLSVGLLPLLFQAGFVAGLYVWSTSAPRHDEEEKTTRERSSTEQISTLGYLYSQSLTPAATFERINVEVLQRLSKALRCKPADVRGQLVGLSPEVRDRCSQVLKRLAELLPAQEIRCVGCGYDLRGNVSGRCPECGAVMTPDLKDRAAGAVTDPAGASGRARRPEAVLAEVLEMSHQLSQEIRRDKRAGR